MSLAKGFFATCDGLIDRLLCLAGAVAISQFPEFFQQYAQRLGGHVDEARRQVAQYVEVARASNLTLDQFIQQTSANADAAVAKLGAVMAGAAERLHSLEASQNALTHASLFSRPWVFAQNFDATMAAATLHLFRPALPVTLEGLIYALIGMLFFLGLYHLLVRTPVRVCYRHFRRDRAPRVVEI
jgi:DUF2937 family protein